MANEFEADRNGRVKMSRVSIIGGGNVSHALVAVLARFEPVTVVTRQPFRWSNHISCSCDDESFVQSKYPLYATSDMNEISHSSVIVIALPQFAVSDVIVNLTKFVAPGSTVIFVPSPAMITKYVEVLLKFEVGIVGLQRVPFVSRIVEYGKSVRISGFRTLNRFATAGPVNVESFSKRLISIFGGKISTLSSMLSLAFSNSNALLHPSRMIVLFRGWKNRVYRHNPLFYGEWTDESSELYVSADREMYSVMRQFHEINVNADYESVLDHYGVTSPYELTLKLRSIKSLNSLVSPMVKKGECWLPDFSSRYFTEDVTYGTKTIQTFAQMVAIPTPTIDYLVDGVSNLVLGK